MHERELQAFVDATVSYFQKLTDSPASVGIPSVLPAGESKALAVTAAIGVTGAVKGAIYLTAETAFFLELLKTISPSAPLTEQNALDLAGEVANTVAGNAQRVFGPQFLISVPLVIAHAGNEPGITMREPQYSIPILWNGHKVYMVVGLSSAA